MIKACIFDLGGTIVDKYSLTPFLALKEIFENKKIYMNNNLIHKYIGIDKKDHISKIINHKNITKQWFTINDNYPNESDIHNLFNEFNEIQGDYCKNLMTILPETQNCIQYLKRNNILTGCTTGFDKGNMNIIKQKLEYHNLPLDSYISSTCLNKPSRPYPFMIEENMKNLKINNPKSIIKIDDTAIGIQEGQNANCWTVGVARWSTNMNIFTINDAYGLDIHELNNNLKISRKRLLESGADFVIDTLDELPMIIHKLNFNQLL